MLGRPSPQTSNERLYASWLCEIDIESLLDLRGLKNDVFSPTELKP